MIDRDLDIDAKVVGRHVFDFNRCFPSLDPVRKIDQGILSS